MTLARATLAVGVAALAADSFTNTTPVALLVALAAVALALDAADGWVARRTGTATALGARFDGEVDAFLILALSVYVAPASTARGCSRSALARYAFLAGEWLLPWMRATLPRRRWRRAVAAAQGVVLTVAAAGVLPRATTQVLLAVALVSLAASMGECVRWLWRRRPPRPSRQGRRRGAQRARPAARLGRARRAGPARPRSTSAGSRGSRSSCWSLVAVAALLPATPRRVLAVIAGAVLSVLIVVKVLDIGFFTAFDRPFRPVDDSSYAGIGVETLRDAIGRSTADLAVVGAAVLLARDPRRSRCWRCCA